MAGRHAVERVRRGLRVRPDCAGALAGDVAEGATDLLTCMRYIELNPVRVEPRTKGGDRKSSECRINRV